MQKYNLVIVLLTTTLLGGCSLGGFTTGSTSNPQAETNPMSVSTPPTSSSQAKTTTPASAAPTSKVTLTIDNPRDGSTTSTPTVVLKGRTVPNAEVSVNETEIKATATGVFAVTVDLNEGENSISVLANDADGNYAETEVLVTYTP
jgi:hypothetical protein